MSEIKFSIASRHDVEIRVERDQNEWFPGGGGKDQRKDKNLRFSDRSVIELPY